MTLTLTLPLTLTRYGPAALYGAGLEGHMRLHPRYNVLGRTAKHAAEQRVERVRARGRVI